MLAIFFFTQACCGFVAGFYHGVLRTDDNIEYFTHQDIIQAFNTSKPSWFYGHNFGESNGGRVYKKMLSDLEVSCTYFRKDNLSETNVNFTKHQGKEEPMKKQRLYGTFFTTHGIGRTGAPTKRSTANGVGVSSSLSEDPQYFFKLLYSNYDNCAILRPFPRERLPHDFRNPGDLPSHDYLLQGNSYNSRISPLCVVLLGDDAARNGGLPPKCNATYRGMCGTGPKFTVVFDTTCPPIPKPLGC